MRHKHTKHRKTETQKHKGLLRGSEQYWHLLQALALSFTLTSNPFLPTSIQQTLCCDCKYLPASDFAFVEVLSFCKRAIKPFPSLIETRAYIWFWKRVHQGIRAADLKQILLESFSWQFDWLVDPFTRLAGLTCNNGWWPNDCLISNLPDTHSKNHNDSYDTSSTSNLCLSCDENAAILLGWCWPSNLLRDKMQAFDEKNCRTYFATTNSGEKRPNVLQKISALPASFWRPEGDAKK